MSSKVKKSTKNETETSIAEESVPEQSDTTDRNLMIAEAAYYRAEQRDFTPEQETEDWLEAEKQVEEILGFA